MAENEYITMLEESLEKKIRILQQLQLRNIEQKEILTDNNSSPDDLENNMEAKSILIEQIQQLDDGFEQLFSRVKPVIEDNRELYAEQIKRMKKLIAEITDLSADVQASEQKNKSLAMTRFAAVKKDVREIKKSHAAVASYYQNMLGSKGAKDPQFMDRKK